jgi:hypothetical protein
MSTISNLKDELDSEFIFNSTYSELLVKIANGEINATELAKKELRKRGLNIEGKWVGFSKTCVF